MRKISALFSTLALGAILVVTPNAAKAEESLSSCNPDGIISVFNTGRGQQAFGNDGCVYSVINNAPLAIHNYDLHNPREAQTFSRAYNSAQTAATRQEKREQTAMEREIARQERQERARQQRCESAKSRAFGNAIGNLIRGRDALNANDARNIAQHCAGGLF